jgi:hypothetical protein
MCCARQWTCCVDCRFYCGVVWAGGCGVVKLAGAEVGGDVGVAAPLAVAGTA